MAKPVTHKLTDGTTITIRAQSTILGPRFVEVPSRKRNACAFQLIDGHMYLELRSDLVRITHPDYEYAASSSEGARKALAFCADSAESCIAHAAAEGIDVSECY